MASRALTDVLAAIASANGAQDGDQLALLLSLDKSRLAGGAAFTAAVGDAATTAARIRDAVNAVFPPSTEAGKSWSVVLIPHLAACGAAARSDWETAFTHSHEALSQFLSILQASATNWLVRTLHTLIHDTVAAVRRYEGQLKAAGVREGSPEKVNSLVTTLRNAFNYTLNHRLPKDQLPLSKKWGALYVVNTLFAIFFKADQLRQCKFFIKGGVESPVFPPLEQFPRSQVVTYRYYTGVLACYEDDYARAYALLTSAFRDCHRDYFANRRKILVVLVPVSLYARGRIPSPRLLARYGLSEAYGPIVEALRTGNVALYNSAMERNRDWYIRSGVYLTLERLQMLVYRTLFRKLCKQLSDLTGSVQIRLPHLQIGLRAAGLDVDADEVECLLANHVFRKMIRGYISHKPPVLVLAKAGAFKPLPEVLAATGPAGAGATAADP